MLSKLGDLTRQAINSDLAMVPEHCGDHPGEKLSYHDRALAAARSSNGPPPDRPQATRLNRSGESDTENPYVRFDKRRSGKADDR